MASKKSAAKKAASKKPSHLHLDEEARAPQAKSALGGEAPTDEAKAAQQRADEIMKTESAGQGQPNPPVEEAADSIGVNATGGRPSDLGQGRGSLDHNIAVSCRCGHPQELHKAIEGAPQAGGECMSPECTGVGGRGCQRFEPDTPSS